MLHQSIITAHTHPGRSRSIDTVAKQSIWIALVGIVIAPSVTVMQACKDSKYRRTKHFSDQSPAIIAQTISAETLKL